MIAARDMVGQCLPLLPERRDQAIDPAPVLGALADDVDIGIVHGAHLIVGDDGPLHGQPAVAADLGIRA